MGFFYIDIQEYLSMVAIWMWLNSVLLNPRENTKEKDKTEAAPEETEEREQAAPRAEKLPIAKVVVRAESPDQWQMKLHKQMLLQLQPLKSHLHLFHPHQNLVSSIYRTLGDPSGHQAIHWHKALFCASFFLGLHVFCGCVVLLNFTSVTSWIVYM